MLSNMIQTISCLKKETGDDVEVSLGLLFYMEKTFHSLGSVYTIFDEILIILNTKSRNVNIVNQFFNT